MTSALLLTSLWAFSIGSPMPQQEGTRVASEVDEQAAEDTDGTAEYDTEGSLDLAISESRLGIRDWNLFGDLRPIFAYFSAGGPDGEDLTEDDLGIRARLSAFGRIAQRLHLGSGLAFRCASGACDVDFIAQPDLPGPNGLRNGQITFDELFAHWFQLGERQRFDILLGRIQTRFVLRGGVYAKSLDRNDSNNTRVTWTDGMNVSYRFGESSRSSFVWQRNDPDGSGSIRRGPLDFDSDRARNTYFWAFENVGAWGPIVQRGLDLSYLPDSLLKDNDANGRRENYWGAVGRLALRWPQRSEALRFRGGLEVGFAPETPTRQASGFLAPGDVGGFAWNVVANAMDFASGHSVGVNYGETQAGWLLSPQFFPNTDLLEFRYQWRTKRGPTLEARVRWQEELDEKFLAHRPRSEFDFYVRLTWEWGSPTTRLLRGPEN